MGLLGRLFGTLFGRIISFFGAYISTKLAIFVAATTAFLALLAGLTVAFNAALNSIAVAVPAELQFGLGIIPGNVPVCVSAVITARVAIWMVQVKWTIVKIKMQG